MKSRALARHGGQTYAVIFDKGEEVVKGLLDFVTRHGFTTGQITAIGGFSDVTLGFFDREQRRYQPIHLQEQVEVLSLNGDIALEDGKPKIHAHVVVGKADGSAHGGHLLEAHVWPTLEVVLVREQGALQRSFDPETGLALISP